MQYNPHNYIITILKTHFFGKTLHHVKKIFCLTMTYNCRRISDSDSTPRLPPKIEEIAKTMVKYRITFTLELARLGNLASGGGFSLLLKYELIFIIHHSRFRTEQRTQGKSLIYLNKTYINSNTYLFFYLNIIAKL